MNAGIPRICLGLSGSRAPVENAFRLSKNNCLYITEQFNLKKSPMAVSARLFSYNDLWDGFALQTARWLDVAELLFPATPALFHIQNNLPNSKQ